MMTAVCEDCGTILTKQNSTKDSDSCIDCQEEYLSSLSSTMDEYEDPDFF